MAAVGGALFAVGIAGCDTRKEPSAANFEEVINAALKDTKLCTGVRVMDPNEVPTFLATFEENQFHRPVLQQKVRPALAAGKAKILEYTLEQPFVKKEPDSESKALYRDMTMAGFDFSGLYTFRFPQVLSPTVEVIILNENGLRYFHEEKKNDGFQTYMRRSICYGELKVGKILRWTEPAERFGYKVTSVEYTLEATNVAPWAKSMAKFLDLKPRKRDLLLTNEGWSADLSILKQSSN